MAPTPDLVCFLLMSQTLAAASSSGRAYPSMNFLPPLFLRLAPTLIMWGSVNISLNDSSSLSFLNVYAPSIGSSPKDSRTNFFSPSILPFYVEAEAASASASTEKGPLPLPASASASTSLNSRQHQNIEILLEIKKKHLAISSHVDKVQIQVYYGWSK